MGLYDRDYGREYGEETEWDRHQRSQQPKSITVILVIITVAFFFVDMFLPYESLSILISGENAGDLDVKKLRLSWMMQHLAVGHETPTRPWLWWQFLSYGFVHDANRFGHILFNMIGLFVFGRPLEQQLGRDEFLRFYLISIIVGGIAGAIGFLLEGVPGAIVGASGGTVAVTVLFACNFPHQTVLFMLVFPVKAWILAVGYVSLDVLGAMGLTGMRSVSAPNTAFVVHLAGAAFALAYFYQRWNFQWIDLNWFREMPSRLRDRSRRMKLKIHDPDKKLQEDASQADRILAKIEEEGEDSLTPAERKTLERYSRRLRQKRKQDE